MFEYTVRVSALHYSTGSRKVRRVWALASAHVLHLTPTIMCLSISDSIPESSEVNLEKWSVALEEIEHRVQMEARVIPEVGIRVQNHRVVE